MDDIARDPLRDAHVTPEKARCRFKGPAAEFGVEASDDEVVDHLEDEPAAGGSSSRDDTFAEDLDDAPLEDAAIDRGVYASQRADHDDSAMAPRLPRVLPLSPVDDDDDDDLLGAPAVEAAARATGVVRGAGEHGPQGREDAGGESDADADVGEDPDPDAEVPPEGPSAEGAAPPEPRPDPTLDGDGVAEPVTDPAKLARVVFGLLLTNRDGLSALRLAQVCDTTQEAVRGAIETLRSDLLAQGAPLELQKSGDAFKLWTTPEVFPYLEKLRGIKKNERLSPAALETLAVIAYRQPVFRAEIEAIRGVKAGPMLRTLLDCKLVKVVGRADVPGRPLQYGTTQQFLERFGLSALTDLPSVKEFKGLSG